MWENEVDFETLKGKVLTNIEGLEKGNDRVIFITNTGEKFIMYHSQSCCEGVSIEDICGDVNDLLNIEVTLAEVSISYENPVDAKNETIQHQESFTWTFYKLATAKGFVTIRWYGQSNGYYSESVEFEKCETEMPF